MGFLVRTVGDPGVGEGGAVAAEAAAAAAVARVTRRRMEPFSPTTVASFSALSLLRRCREIRWLLRVFLRDNLVEGAEQKLRHPGKWGGCLKFQLEELLDPVESEAWRPKTRVPIQALPPLAKRPQMLLSEPLSPYL